MNNNKSFETELYTVNEASFGEIALRLFQFQAVHNPVYKAFLDHLKVHPSAVSDVQHIPFLPISFFKTQTVKTGSWNAETSFRSSGTTGMSTSTHFVKDLSFYKRHAKRCFECFFGPVSGYHFFALLPSYLERKDSSLISMIDFFIHESGSQFSGFYLSDFDKLSADIQQARLDGSRKVVVWGVSFALLDLAEQVHPDLSDCLVFETGGMKGRRREVTRMELHDRLKTGLNVPSIYSEYGMTELFSQAYMGSDACFRNPPWMSILVREIGDPFTVLRPGKPGGINVIDLANFDSVAFIETEDVGVCYPDGSFDIQGRLDSSDLRGCNLLIE